MILHCSILAPGVSDPPRQLREKYAMEAIRIRHWGFIPVDTDPTRGAPLELSPPMFTAVAMERGASIVFEYSVSPGIVDITVEVTALSGGDRGPHLFRLYSGTAVDSI